MIIRLLSHIMAKEKRTFFVLSAAYFHGNYGKVYHNKDLHCGAKKTLFFMAHSQRRSEGQNGFSQFHVDL